MRAASRTVAYRCGGRSIEHCAQRIRVRRGGGDRRRRRRTSFHMANVARAAAAVYAFGPYAGVVLTRLNRTLSPPPLDSFCPLARIFLALLDT
ncbi:hypothetical protein BURMUCGD1_4195 [Burkholderia multivorans CGD1]|nr:hypothetical protein BURMUCGD1_4195 [Burkholderia multivorans CGD1]